MPAKTGRLERLGKALLLFPPLNDDLKEYAQAKLPSTPFQGSAAPKFLKKILKQSPMNEIHSTLGRKCKKKEMNEAIEFSIHETRTSEGGIETTEEMRLSRMNPLLEDRPTSNLEK